MFNSSVIEVAIGLSFIFLLLSLICSAIVELIESVLKNRATDLERGIRERQAPFRWALRFGLIS